MTNSFLKHFHYGALNPVRDWLTISTVSLIALASIVVWNVWAFGTVAQGGTIGSVATSSTSTLNQFSLDQINNIFSSRAAEENKYMSGVYIYADPSQ